MSRLGAYGFTVDGLPGAASVLAPADDGWPVLAVHRAVAQEPAPPESLQDRLACLHTSDGGYARVDGAAGTVSLRLRRDVADPEVVHPFLALPCAVLSRWLGRDSFHAGAFVHEGKAWVVVGDKGQGKSSTMAGLDGRGVPVLADDLVVVDGDRALRGPRCVDLRPDAAQHLGVGTYLGVVGARERSRLPVAAAPPSVPLGGWLCLQWGDGPSARPVPPAERIARVIVAQSLNRDPLSAERLLDQAALPMHDIVRPRDWDRFDATLDLVLETASAG